MAERKKNLALKLVFIVSPTREAAKKCIYSFTQQLNKGKCHIILFEPQHMLFRYIETSKDYIPTDTFCEE